MRVLSPKTDIYFWSYIYQFFLEWEMFQTKVIEKIETRISCSITFFRQSCRLCDNAEKYFRAGMPQMTMWCRRVASWITKSANTLSEYETLTDFLPHQWLHKAPQCYVIRTLPVLFCFNFKIFIKCVRYYLLRPTRKIFRFLAGTLGRFLIEHWLHTFRLVNASTNQMPKRITAPIQYLFFLGGGGATAPSGPWPPHSRGV